MPKLVGGWTNPSEIKMDHFPPNRGEHQKIFELPPPSLLFWVLIHQSKNFRENIWSQVLLHHHIFFFMSRFVNGLPHFSPLTTMAFLNFRLMSISWGRFESKEIHLVGLLDNNFLNLSYQAFYIQVHVHFSQTKIGDSWLMIWVFASDDWKK